MTGPTFCYLSQSKQPNQDSSHKYVFVHFDFPRFCCDSSNVISMSLPTLPELLLLHGCLIIISSLFGFMINWSMALIVPDVEQQVQGGAIGMYKKLEGRSELITTVGFRSYGQYFTKDIGSLSSLIDRIDKDLEKARLLKTNSRSRIQQSYTWDRVTDQYFELICSASKGLKINRMNPR